MSADQTKPAQGVTLRDSGRHADSIVGGPNIDTLISNIGDDTLKGNGGVDIYVINNTNFYREVKIIDKGINKLAIDNGTNMMTLDIQQNAVLLDGKQLEIATTSSNGHNTFKYTQGNLTLLITPDDEINNPHTSAVETTNPLLQNMAELPLEGKLAALNHIHDQMLLQQTFSQKTNPHQEADNQFA